MKPIRWGLIGTGNIAEIATRELRAIEGVTVKAVFSPPSPRRDEFCRAFSISTAVDSLNDLLALPLDAVFIAPPNKFHATYATRALGAGKHVLLDKPFATSRSEAEQVATALDSQDDPPHFSLGMNLRFLPEAERTKAAIVGGTLGAIHQVQATWLRRSGIPKLGSWFGSRELAGGGVLLDLGVHVLDLVSFVLDDFEYESVSATTRSTYGPQGLGHGDWGKSSQSDLPFDVEDSATARLRLRSGTIVNLDLAWAGPFEQDERLDVVVRGEKGALSLHSNQVVPGPGSTASVLETPTLAVRSRFEHFCRLIRGQASPVITVEEALRVQGVLDAIYTSAASGHEIAIPPVSR